MDEERGSTHIDDGQPWWTAAVVYQIYPRSFCDSNGDGIGDLQGIISKLDHLVDLGVDVLWLSPIYTSPHDDNGYDIADYQAIDPMFGTLDDFDELVAGLHSRGIKLVMDLVVNHTSDEHAWFQDSRDPASDKRDWYYWLPPRAGFEPGTPGAEPTNWASFFGGSSWEYDAASGEYYLHLFSRKQPDLNWNNEAVRRAVYAMMNWWVDRGVDGFRMDVINLVSKTLPLTDGLVQPGQTLSYDLGHVANGPRMIEFLEEMNAAVGMTERQLFTVGEMVMCDAQQARQYTSRFHPRLGMVFTFEHMNLDQHEGLDKFALKPLHLPDLKRNLAHWQRALHGEGWNSLYWANHDQPRIVSRFGDDSPRWRAASAKAWATVLHLHQGTPYIYQGEEIGMTNAGFTSIEQYRDIESLGAYADGLSRGASEADLLAALALKSRDNARTPLPWQGGVGAGFTSGTPWLPINENADAINVAADREGPEGVFEHYRRLVALRHALPVIRHGEFELLLPDHEKLWVFTRSWPSERLLVIANMSSEASGVPMSELPSVAGAELLLGTPSDGSDVQTLAPWAARVYRLKNG